MTGSHYVAQAGLELDPFGSDLRVLGLQVHHCTRAHTHTHTHTHTPLKGFLKGYIQAKSK
jgi:hypothetical protein